jgi:alanyl-tRNA synthetase
MALSHGYLNSIGIKPVTNQSHTVTPPEEKEFSSGGGGATSSKSAGGWNGTSVRKTFIEFFQKKCGHDFVRSSPVVPLNDPTLLFINAGMNQFKPIFTGQIDPSHPHAKLKRAANSQKCIRAGGKHNDLEDVGKDVYHHTFFEMLGNWSFGDYFKKEAIEWAWTLLTEVYKIDPNRLYATYYGGDPKQPNVPADEEARQIWLKYLPASRVLPFDMKDNFWEMGDTGPCGPCTEIHYDRIGGRDAAALVNLDDPDVLEIWNNVFMQFNRETDGSLTNLPNQSVDTGMGLERVVSVLMDKRSNYDTDLFTPIFAAIQQKTGCRDYTGKVGAEDKDTVDMAYRVIADHIRTLTISLTDGAVPSNEGRGYVLRRVLRRAVRYGRDILGAPPGFFYQLVDAVVDTLGDAFPELKERPQDVKEIIKAEEEQFGRTLDKGIKEFKTRAKKGKITGEDAFLLSSSYGFPVDLTVLMAEEQGIQVDEKGYEEKMAAFRDQSKAGGSFKNRKDMQMQSAQTDELANKMKLARTDESLKYKWDSTGEGEEYSTKVMAIYNGKTFDDSCKAGSEVVGLVLERTPCYAEQGGQVFDTATITGKGIEFQCDDVQKYAGYVVHIGTLKSGSIKKGDTVGVKVDYTRRALIAKNHTCTHILNFALREVLGEKIDQKGSLVDESKLRFDFSHAKPIETEELKKIEDIVNREIAKKHAIIYKEAPLADAFKIGGLRAVFGENYPDPVRVVSVGPDVDKMLGDTKTLWGRQYSVEFCGGTHVANSEEIYRFVLQVEEGIAKGVRRIVGVTGPTAHGDAVLRLKTLTMKLDKATTMKGAALEKMIADCRTEVSTDKEVSLVGKKELMVKLEALNDGSKTAGKADKKEAEKKAKEVGEKLAAEASSASGDTFVAVVDAGAGDDAKALCSAEIAISKKVTNKALLLLSNAGGKLAVLSVVPKDLQGKLSAKDWAGKVLEAIGGKGGGTDARAQGQVTDASLLDKALAAAKAGAGASSGGAKEPAAKDAKKADKKGDKKDKGKDDEKAPEDPAKLLKKVIKEGGKRGVEIEGAADMGGLQFFCTSVDEPQGDVNLLEESVKAMNTKSDPTEEERKGGSGHIGKMVFSAGTERLAIAAYVPDEKQGECSCEEWLQKVVGMWDGGKILKSGKDYCFGEIPTNSDKNIFPLKIRESLILEANNFLRRKGLFPEDKGSDSDEMVFGDDDFPSM